MRSTATIRAGLAAEVLNHHFGKSAREVRRLQGGLANHVFEGKVGRDTLIVRIGDDPAKLQTFTKEQWAVAQARAAGVPVPEILEVGHTAIPFPYMIAVKKSGVDATRWPRRLEVARQMGELAARINTVKTSAFGSVFDWSPNKLSRNKSWRDFLERELHADERLELFARHKMVSPSDLKKLRRHVRLLKAWTGRPALTHGDIRFKNVVLDENGKIQAILDWENCTSNCAPQWEISIALHDLSIDEKQAFVEGYGLSAREFARIAPAIKTINMLNYHDAIQHALKNKDEKRLQNLRLRLHGVFDLHTL
jgi:aminoglycoside phosphotransferase (APT) family kinase protein